MSLKKLKFKNKKRCKGFAMLTFFVLPKNRQIDGGGGGEYVI
jgi:hypothetical protein